MEINKTEIGVCAFGLKTGIITFDDNMKDVVKKYFDKNKNILNNKDILCMTEAVVAITQKNFVNLEDVSIEIKNKLNLKENSTIGIVFPIFSRNRFSMILKAIAKTVPLGKVIIQLSFPRDEQGNPILSKDFCIDNNITLDEKLDLKKLDNLGKRYLHPETGMDYIDFYKQIVEKESKNVEIYLANKLNYIINSKPDGIICCNVHNRQNILNEIKKLGYKNIITLQDICSNSSKKEYSEYGLLGSNILDPEKNILKLAPKDGDLLCENIKQMIFEEFDKDIEVLIYGDGAYKDPESGIYELADPVSCFGCTKNIKNKNKTGVKSKYLMQKLYSQGKNKKEILEFIENEKQRVLKENNKNDFSSEGTTPRKIENLISSLADLISGSADSNTPLVLVKNYL
ncbi:MAG: coenzyme F420-0:L-glutamate ligase [Candidatus ainarchaeum sp.]|nr:coenzyme F420-0:L-glutamate ligase [Candidatus ainarchaeum sp.]MDD3976212.1 coenzyme F420-0:L-glutamate ligase [Candidatus ainarchaeum sp.]